MAKAKEDGEGQRDARWLRLLTTSAGSVALLTVSPEIFWGAREISFDVIGGLTALIVAALLLPPATHLVLMRHAQWRDKPPRRRRPDRRY